MYKIKFKDIDKKVLIGLPFGLMALLYLVVGLAHSTKNFTSFTLDRMIINDIIGLFFPLGYLFYVLFTKKHKKKLMSISIGLFFSGMLIIFLEIIPIINDFKYGNTIHQFGSICIWTSFILMFVDAVKREILKKREIKKN